MEREYAIGVVRQLFESMLAEAPEDDHAACQTSSPARRLAAALPQAGREQRPNRRAGGR